MFLSHESNKQPWCLITRRNFNLNNIIKFNRRLNLNIITREFWGRLLLTHRSEGNFHPQRSMSFWRSQIEIWSRVEWAFHPFGDSHPVIHSLVPLRMPWIDLKTSRGRPDCIQSELIPRLNRWKICFQIWKQRYLRSRPLTIFFPLMSGRSAVRSWSWLRNSYDRLALQWRLAMPWSAQLKWPLWVSWRSPLFQTKDFPALCYFGDIPPSFLQDRLRANDLPPKHERYLYGPNYPISTYAPTAHAPASKLCLIMARHY